VHGDLLFAGAERVVRTATAQREHFAAAILDVSRADDINDVARALLAGLGATLQTVGKRGFLVDPDGMVVPKDSPLREAVYDSGEDAVTAAEAWLAGRES